MLCCFQKLKFTQLNSKLTIKINSVSILCFAKWINDQYFVKNELFQYWFWAFLAHFIAE